MSNELAQEMIENCQPTKEEFDELLEGIIFTTEMLWDFTLWIPRWDALSPEADPLRHVEGIE